MNLRATLEMIINADNVRIHRLLKNPKRPSFLIFDSDLFTDFSLGKYLPERTKNKIKQPITLKSPIV
jgi:hypothetical protein